MNSQPKFKGGGVVYKLLNAIVWLSCFTRINSEGNLSIIELAEKLGYNNRNRYIIGLALKLIYEDDLYKKGVNPVRYNLELTENNFQIKGKQVYELMNIIFKEGSL